MCLQMQSAGKEDVTDILVYVYLHGKGTKISLYKRGWLEIKRNHLYTMSTMHMSYSWQGALVHTDLWKCSD